MKAVLSGDWQTLDAIAKGWENGTKKKLNTEEEKYPPIVCCIIKYNVNIRWVDCRECTSLVHYLCECIPSGTYFGDNAVYECLYCKSFITETLEGYFVVKLQKNRDRQSEDETQILTKSSDSEA